MLARWGNFVYRRRWVVLVLSVGFVVLSIAGVLKGSSPSFNGNTTGTESASADQLVKEQLPAQNAHSLTLLYRSSTMTAGDPTFHAALQASIQPLQADSRVQSIMTPYDAGPAAASLVSRNQHEALAIVTLKDDPQASNATYSDLRGELGPTGPLQVLGTGGLAINAAFNTELGHDLSTASRTSLPITALLLRLVFGTVVAALLPLGVGALAVAGGFGGIFVLARLVDVSQYATDLTALVGLGVGIDYSLFIVSRYREQLARGSSPQESLEVAMATAGRSVIFSGLIPGHDGPGRGVRSGGRGDLRLHPSAGPARDPWPPRQLVAAAGGRAAGRRPRLLAPAGKPGDATAGPRACAGSGHAGRAGLTCARTSAGERRTEAAPSAERGPVRIRPDR